jgi:hypothetical protein
LVYQTGHITYSQHYHDDEQHDAAGSYFFTHRQRWLYDTFIGDTAWVAEVALLGQSWLSHRNDRRRCGCRYGIAEAVQVIRIHARCYAYEAHDVLRQLGYGWNAHNNHELTCGVLLPYPYQAECLVPVCHKTPVPVEHAPLQFQIRDGEVFFSNRA